MRNTIKKILKENDFDWANNVEPISVEEIQSKMLDGYMADHGIINYQITDIAKKVHKLGLLKRELDILVHLLEDLSDYAYEAGTQTGWEEGHTEGWREKQYECEEEEEEIKDEGYREGYDEGYEAGSPTFCMTFFPTCLCTSLIRII